MKYYLILQVETDKPVADLTDTAAGIANRAYAMQEVEDAHVVLDRDGIAEAAFKQLANGVEPCRTSPTVM